MSYEEDMSDEENDSVLAVASAHKNLLAAASEFVMAARRADSDAAQISSDRIEVDDATYDIIIREFPPRS